MANVPNGEASWSRPETFGFGPVNIQIYILPCGPLYSLFHCLSTSLTRSLARLRARSLSLSAPPLPHFLLSLTPSPSLVVRIHPTAEWLLCLCLHSHGESLNLNAPASVVHPVIIPPNLPLQQQQHASLHVRVPQVAQYLLWWHSLNKFY